MVHCIDTGSVIISEENDSENAGIGFQYLYVIRILLSV